MQAPTEMMPSERQNSSGKVTTFQTAFIRSISQELHTPIEVLQGYAELLYGGGLGELAPEQQEALFIIVNRAEELKTMVSRINILLDAQAQSGVAQPFALSILVAQMLERQREKAVDAGIRLNVSLGSSLPLVRGIGEQIQAAVESLLENALKFTPYGGSVDIEVGQEAEWLYVSIADTGIGIAEEELTGLLQPLSLAPGLAGAAAGGLGLGLTLVKQVVANHEGVLEIQSKLGEGSRFTLKVPALPAGEPVDEEVAGAGAVRRILVVDDEEFVAFTLQEGLEKLPHCEVHIAMSGAGALALFAEQPFDLLITDYKMPDMNGVELAAQVRTLYPHTNIIMVTAYSNHLVYEPAAAASIQRILNKPIRLSEIRTAALETLNIAF